MAALGEVRPKQLKCKCNCPSAQLVFRFSRVHNTESLNRVHGRNWREMTDPASSSQKVRFMAMGELQGSNFEVK